jgi:hypothetical protein
MSTESLSKAHVLQQFAAAYERVIDAAANVAERGMPYPVDGFGPREVVAHLAGWEVMASVRIPHIVNGMAPLEFADPLQSRVMNDAINAAFVTMVGDQSLEAICGMLRRAYRRTLGILDPLSDSFFQPGEYVYERTLGVIDHCREHVDIHLTAKS